MKFATTRGLSIFAAFAFCFLLESVARGQSDFTQRLISFAGLYVTLAVSLNLINGITGQFSIGHAAFYQVGAYSAAYFGKTFYSSWHFGQASWIVLMVFVGALVSAIAGFVVGLPSLRLRGDYLAIVTLGFGEIVRIVIQNQEVLGQSGGMDVNPHLDKAPVFLVTLLAILCIAVCRNLLKTAHGLPFLAVREDEVASMAMGVNVTKTKVTAFVLGSAFAGAAGAIYANSLGNINPDLFQMDVSFIILTMVVLGGTGSITGSTIAALVLFYIPEKMRDIKDVQTGLLLGILVAVFAGVIGIRWIINNYHRPIAQRSVAYVGITVGAFVLAIILGKIAGTLPAFQVSVDGGKIRLVVFAITLIVLMLIRPQGVFAHHEFSWDWVKKLMGRKDYNSTEVAA